MSSESSPSFEEEAIARARFLLRFADPYRVLDERGQGRGALAALSIGLFLCERYFRFKSNSTDLWREEAFLREAATHFETGFAFFSQFWECYRHGMQYSGAPKTDGQSGWDINDAYPAAPTRALDKGKTIICLNPWKFTEEMIVLCWNDPAALVKLFDAPVEGNPSGPLKWKPVPVEKVTPPAKPAEPPVTSAT